MKKYFLLMLSIMLFACNSPMDKPYSEETIKEDIKEMEEKDAISTEEKELLAGWLMKTAFTGEDLEGKTYSEIIEEAKEFKKEQKELAEQAKKEEEEKRKRLGSALTVALFDKGFEKYNYQDYLTYSLAFKNKTDKNIRAFKGTLSVQDLFDTEIKSITLTIDDPISAGGTFKGVYTTDYNQFLDEDSRLRNKDLEDLKVVWTPEKIIFEDGSTLE